MRYDIKSTVFTATGKQTERPAIVMEYEGDRLKSLKLLTGRSGIAEISKPELLQLALIAAEAADHLNGPKLG